jgi:hypothetical protein
LEDIFGLTLFVLYLIFGVLGNRKKGMKKDRRSRRPEPFKELKEVFRQQEQPKRVPKTRNIVGERAFSEEKAPASADTYRQTFPAIQRSREENPQETAEFIPEYSPRSLSASAEPAIELDAASIRQAVIWNEILQKPVSLRRSGEHLPRR